jgi:hypothetical protein
MILRCNKYACCADLVQKAKHEDSHRPHVSREAITFHSIISPDSVLNLDPGENEAFKFLISTDPGCAHVGIRFRVRALYHDQGGVNSEALSQKAFEVLADHERTYSRVL